MADDNKKQMLNIATGVITAIIASLFAWKLNVYSENNNRVEQLLRELEIKKASIEYVDKENQKQDRVAEKNIEKIDRKLDYIIDQLVKR